MNLGKLRKKRKKHSNIFYTHTNILYYNSNKLNCINIPEFTVKIWMLTRKIVCTEIARGQKLFTIIPYSDMNKKYVNKFVESV